MVAPKNFSDDDVKLGGFDHNHTYLLAVSLLKNNLHPAIKCCDNSNLNASRPRGVISV